MAVIIKGQSITGSQESRDHYLRGPENERITVREVLGFATKDPEEALRMIELSALGTKCKKPIYSAKINPETDRIWTKEEIRRAVDLLEENLGLQGHPRVVVEHKKKGRIHFHILWSRYHPDGGPAKNMGNDYDAHQKTQKQLQKELKLKPMMAKGRDFRHWEVEWAKRYGFDIFKLREQITKDFNTSKSGQEFKHNLETKGMILCRGDKGQFILILPWGQHKALSSMIIGRPIKTALTRALSDIDIKRLPNVPEGKAIVRARLPKVKRAPRNRDTYTKSRPSQIVTRKTNEALIEPQQSTILTSLISSPIATDQQIDLKVTSQAERTINQDQAEEKKVKAQLDTIDEQAPPSLADIAYKEEFDKWTGLIEAAAHDLSVSKEQRQANVKALRDRQHAAARGAAKRAREEERSTANARRRAKIYMLGIVNNPK